MYGINFSARSMARRSAPLASGAALVSMLALMVACQDATTEPSPVVGNSSPSFGKGGGGGGGGGSPASRIVFVSQRDQPGNVDLYMSNPDGTGITRLTTDPGVDDQPALSHDGTRVAFVTTRFGNETVMVMDLTGPGAWQLTAGQMCATPAWSADDSRVAYSCYINGDFEIYTSLRTAGSLVQLTNNATNDIAPTYSPNTPYIAFSSLRDGNYEIYSMRTDGTSATRLTNSASPDLDPAWSPDGKLIAFVSARAGTGLEIYSMKPDGSQVTRLTNNGFADEEPSWSPDSKKLTFQSYLSGILAVHTMNADGSGGVRITSFAANNPTWGR